MEPLILLTFLFTKHILADYFFQRAWMFPDKGVYGAWGGVAHAITHAILTSFILMFFTDVFTAQALAVLDGLLHYHIDYIKNNERKNTIDIVVAICKIQCIVFVNIRLC